MVGKGVLKERLLQVVPPTTQVVLWRRVSRFKLQLRGRQETRRGRRGGGVAEPHQQRGGGAWMRLRIRGFEGSRACI